MSTHKNRSKAYVGLKDGVRRVFRSDTTPTEDVHGREYTAIIGPFRTVRGARFMALYGANWPHCQTVDDAERHAKLLRTPLAHLR